MAVGEGYNKRIDNKLIRLIDYLIYTETQLENRRGGVDPIDMATRSFFRL